MANEFIRENLTTQPAIATKEDLRMLSFQVDSGLRRIKEFESKLEAMSTKWDEFIATVRLRFDRIQGHFQRQGESIQGSFRDVHAKVAAVASRVNERKMSELGIQESVDRQQQLLQTVEARLQQLQKAVAEQELQLMQTRAALQDAQKEIALFKRS